MGELSQEPACLSLVSMELMGSRQCYQFANG